MSDESIKRGDLVAVVRTCCSGTAKESLGKVGVISSLFSGYWKCKHCGATGNEQRAVAFSLPKDCAPLSWLKRIPPLGELEDTPTQEELTA